MLKKSGFKLDVKFISLIIYKVTLQWGISIFSINHIFQPTTTEMRVWMFIQNNETRVENIFKTKLTYPIRVGLILSCDFRSAFESSSKNFEENLNCK